MKKKDLEYRIDNKDSLEELERAFGRTIEPKNTEKILSEVNQSQRVKLNGLSRIRGLSEPLLNFWG